MAFTKVTAAGIGTTEPLVLTGLNAAGVVTATGLYVSGIATFTSNVSIAGTLTYEDVTNIDSVGLITARSGVTVTGGDLNVGSATTISQDNIFTTGIVTATSFSGDGSALTGISSVSFATTSFGIVGTGATAQALGINTTTLSNTKFYVDGNSAGRVLTLADGATITPDFSTGNNFTVTLGGNRTLANPTNTTVGQSGVIYIVQDGTGSRTLGVGTHWHFPAGTAPTLTTTGGSVDVFAFSVRSSTSVVANAILDVKVTA